MRKPLLVAGGVVLVPAVFLLLFREPLTARWFSPAARAELPVAPAVVSEPPAIVIDSTLTEYLRWVAGLSTADTTAEYRRYAELAGQAYATLRQEKLDSLAAFAEATLGEVRRARTVLYPFGGADLVYVTEFFPAADTVVLVGLEPAGTVVDWRDQSLLGRSAFLAKLSQSVRVSNRGGFFITKAMSQDFTDPALNGVVHPMLMYLGWKQYQVMRLSRFDPADPRTALPPGQSGRGMRLETWHPPSQRQVVFEYVRADLSNPGLQQDSAMVRYLTQWPAPVVYLKAASYLLHYQLFSTVRDTLLARAQAVLQDDSGFPLAALEGRFASVRVFGAYYGPISLFANRNQPDLKARYDAPGVPPLGFRMGYGRYTNLQLATAPRP